MKKRGLNGIEEDFIFTGGIVLAGYLAFKHFFPDIIPTIGVSNQDRLTLDTQQAIDPTVLGSKNIFSPLYESASDFDINNLDFSLADNSTDIMKIIYAQYVHGELNPANQYYNTIQIYDNLNTALVGHLISGNQDAINAALNSIKNKWQVGIISELFQDVNGLDFWHLLRYGWGTCIYGLNGADLATAINRLNSLPE